MEPTQNPSKHDSRDDKIQFEFRGGAGADFSDLLKYSNISVPTNVGTATSELANRAMVPPSGQGVKNLNPFAYQSYDRPCNLLSINQPIAQITRKQDKRIDYDKLSKEEAFKIFKKLLTDLGVTATWRWEDARRIVQNEERAKALKAIRDQKQAFNEYISEYKQRERQEARQKKTHLREQFIQMLEESKIINAQSKYYDTARFFVNDPRFRALEDREREDMFQDHLDELEKKEKETLRATTKQHIENLRGLFEEQKLGLDTTWEQCCALLEENPIFKVTDDYERIVAFTDYMKALEKQDYEEKKRIRRYHERKNREHYREMLAEKFRQGQFTIKTKWNKFVVQIKDDPRYYNMLGQPGSTPKELFEDFILSEKENFKQQKATLKQIIKSGGISLSSKMSFQDFEAAFGKYPEYSKIEEKNRRFLHEYVVAKVKQKEQETVKKYMKAVKKYESFIRSLSGISKDSKYEQFKEEIDKKENFNVIPEDEKRMKFYDYVLRIDNKSRSVSEESGALEKPKKEKKKSKKKKRHSETISEHDKKKKRKRRDSSEEYERRSKHHDRERKRSRDERRREHSRDRDSKTKEKQEPMADVPREVEEKKIDKP